MGPKVVRLTVLTPEDEAVAVAFRRYTLLPLDDCLYALQATLPHLTRSSLHRCLPRHGISRLPAMKGDTVKRYHYENHDQLRQHLQTFITACNFAKRLKTLKGLTPYEYVCKIWTQEPKPFKVNPNNHTTGLNI